MLWDRGEGDGWAHHVTTDPPAGTPGHRVLMHAAVGDFQVTTYQADVLARTIGASASTSRRSSPDRSLERVPAFGIPALTSARSRARRSSTGTTARCARTARPATARRRWRTRRRARARTPTSAPRTTPAAREQKSQFLLTGNVVDVCGGAPCTTDFTRAP